MNQTPRLVLVHPEWGIYLGSAMGFGFWSKVDPVGQDAAVTFPDAETAERVMASWGGGRPEGVTPYLVVPDQASTDGFGDPGLTYASVAACVAAGLEGWAP